MSRQISAAMCFVFMLVASLRAIHAERAIEQRVTDVVGGLKCLNGACGNRREQEKPEEAAAHVRIVPGPRHTAKRAGQSGYYTDEGPRARD
jgi:hypothetical protein